MGLRGCCQTHVNTCVSSRVSFVLFYWYYRDQMGFILCSYHSDALKHSKGIIQKTRCHENRWKWGKRDRWMLRKSLFMAVVFSLKFVTLPILYRTGQFNIFCFVFVWMLTLNASFADHFLFQFTCGHFEHSTFIWTTYKWWENQYYAPRFWSFYILILFSSYLLLVLFLL